MVPVRLLSSWHWSAEHLRGSAWMPPVPRKSNHGRLALSGHNVYADACAYLCEAPSPRIPRHPGSLRSISFFVGSAQILPLCDNLVMPEFRGRDLPVRTGRSPRHAI